MQDGLNTSDEAFEAVYLLGFSPAATEHSMREACEGLNMVEFQRHRNLCIWYVHVDRSMFDGPDAEANLTDAKWLAPRVLAHQAAVEQLSSALPFYPAHFGTLFTSMDRIEALVDTNWATLNQFFAGHARHVEWGVKCLVSWPKAVERYQEQNVTEEPSRESRGLDYLRRKKMIRDRDAAVRQWLKDSLVELETRIGELAEQTCMRDASAAACDQGWECLANIALLLPRNGEAALHGFVQSWNQEARGAGGAIRLQTSGPWPLYSFIPSLEPAENLAGDGTTGASSAA